MFAENVQAGQALLSNSQLRLFAIKESSRRPTLGSTNRPTRSPYTARVCGVCGVCVW